MTDTKKIDHAAEALQLIEGAKVEYNERNNVRATLSASLAIAEATLALVEQQRIANLIAARAQSGARSIELRADGESLNTLQAHTDAVIRDALGLDPLDRIEKEEDA